MEAKVEKGKYVHVVAVVDLDNETGELRYVNPAMTAVTSNDPGHPDVEMTVEGATGAERKSWHPVVRFASPEPGEAKVGLIQEDVPYEPWMKVIRLYVKGKEVAKYEAGAPDAAAAVTAAAAAGASLTLAPAPANRPNKRSLRMDREVQPRAGITYTVQVRPEGAGAWHTIAVGRDKPDAEIDRNQFPGASRVDVRVLQTTGFDEHVLSERSVDLSK